MLLTYRVLLEIGLLLVKDKEEEEGKRYEEKEIRGRLEVLVWSFGTLNVGTITRKSRELANMMERRKVDILCVQETRWKGSKAKTLEEATSYFMMVWMEREME